MRWRERGAETLPTDKERYYEGVRFASRTLVPDIEGVSEAYLGFIPMSEFLNIVSDENGEMMQSIFYDNVRDWQDYNAVNGEIRDTLRI